MGIADLAIALLVLAGALLLLWRSLVRRGGACHGCDGAACGRSAPPLVRLGARPADQRRGAAGGASSS
jgi:hypothetical protein